MIDHHTEPECCPPKETQALAQFFAELAYEDIPGNVTARLKLSLLDSLGCCIQGATLPWTRHVEQLALAECAAPVASLFGSGRKTSIALAALVNGTAGHAFELDDIHKESILHPGSLAVPVALAFAQASGHCNGKQLLTAIAAGYELGVRIGNAATMALFFRGFHPQGTSGVFVAAATGAHMLGLGPAAFQNALGIAGSQACGLMAAQEGAMVKRFHSGRAAQSGVYSALLSQQGFTGISDVLEAPYGGFLATLSGNPNLSRLTSGLGQEWEILRVGYKPYPTVTSIHTALDGLAKIMTENGLSTEDIAAIEVGQSKMTHVHCAWEYKAQGVTAAQMNLFFCMALVGCRGKVLTTDFEPDCLADPDLLEFITRIKATVDPEIDGMGPAFRHAARVVVTDRTGRRIEELVLHRRGSPENPLTHKDVEHKFRSTVSRSLTEQECDRIVALIAHFEELDDLHDVMDLIFRGNGLSAMR